MRKFCIFGLGICLELAGGCRTGASTLSIYDNTFEVQFHGASLLNTTLTAVWGTYAGGVFIPNGPWYGDGGYGPVDLTAGAPELQVLINRTDGSQYAPGTPLSLAIFDRPDLSDWDTSAARVVLSDPSWVALSWTMLNHDVQVGFTANTSAQEGGFAYRATGNDVITMVPEPSSGALVASAALLSLAQRRRVRNPERG